MGEKIVDFKIAVGLLIISLTINYILWKDFNKQRFIVQTLVGFLIFSVGIESYARCESRPLGETIGSSPIIVKAKLTKIEIIKPDLSKENLDEYTKNVKERALTKRYASFNLDKIYKGSEIPKDFKINLTFSGDSLSRSPKVEKYYLLFLEDSEYPFSHNGCASGLFTESYESKIKGELAKSKKGAKK